MHWYGSTAAYIKGMSIVLAIWFQNISLCCKRSVLIVLKQRQAAQCVGRVIRSKADYGMMIFADKRCISL